MDEKTVARFWPKIDKRGDDECWPWNACRNENGYGALNMWPSPPMLAHRIAYTLCVGAIPSGLCVCHRCDNPPCCNPKHLFLGTLSDNSRDMVAKGRNVSNFPSGRDHQAAKLTDDDVRAIRAARGLQREIAAEFGVTQALVSLIRLRKIWRHV